MLILPEHRLLRGRWRWQVWESEEDLKRFLAGELILPKNVGKMSNGITDEGIEYVEEVAFIDDSNATNTWFAGLIDNDSFTGVDPSDVIDSHSGWIESSEYSESDRQTLSFSGPTSRTISASVSFTMNATTQIRGIFVVSDNTKGSSMAGPILFSTALFASPPSLSSGNVLTANYSLSD